MSQFDGLADRTRVFPKDDTRTQLGHVEFESAKIGGILLTPIGGTRYANGRLLFVGINDNSCELEARPGPECAGRGVMVQFLFFTRWFKGWMRHCWSWNFDGERDLFVEDQGVSGEREQAPWYRITGQRTADVDGQFLIRDGKGGMRPAMVGEDDGGRYIDAYFANGSDEYYLSDGRRVGIQSLIEAMVKIAEKNNVPFTVR